MGSDFIPNSFQMPNLFVDKFMDILTPEEWKVLSYLARRTFGFNKKQDRISISQFCDGIRTKSQERLDGGTGLSNSTVKRALDSLVEIGLLARIEENDPKKNQGVLWELQLDDQNVNWGLITNRQEAKTSLNHDRTLEASRVKAAQNQAPITSDDTTPSLTYLPSSDDTTPPSSDDTTPPIVGREHNISVQNTDQNPVINCAPSKIEIKEHRTDAVKKGDPMDGILAYAGKSVDPFADYPVDVQDILREFIRLWPADVPLKSRKGKSGDYEFWIGGARTLALASAEYGISILQEVHKDWEKRPFCISHPQALVRTVQGKVVEMRVKKKPTVNYVENQKARTPEFETQLQRALQQRREQNAALLNQQNPVT